MNLNPYLCRFRSLHQQETLRAFDNMRLGSTNSYLVWRFLCSSWNMQVATFIFNDQRIASHAFQFAFGVSAGLQFEQVEGIDLVQDDILTITCREFFCTNCPPRRESLNSMQSWTHRPHRNRSRWNQYLTVDAKLQSVDRFPLSLFDSSDEYDLMRMGAISWCESMIQ